MLACQSAIVEAAVDFHYETGPANARRFHKLSRAALPQEALFTKAFCGAADLRAIPDPTAIRGHFTLVATDRNEVRVLTDCGGSIPIYYGARGRHAFVIGTNVNQVAAALGARVDAISVYDFLANGVVCHPYTWFEGVRVCEPASFTLFDGSTGRMSVSPYWHPSDGEHLGLADAADAVGAMLKRSIADAVAGRPVSILFSGGEDSRLVASLIDAPKRGFIFLESKNREYLLARAAAQVLRFKLDLLARRRSHYNDSVPEKQALIGVGIALEHAHAYGFEGLLPPGIVVGGWGSDTFLKGHYLEKDRSGRPRLGRASTWSTAAPPHAAEELRHRRRARLQALHAPLPHTGYEWDRYWPLSAHEHYANFAVSRRLLNMCEPFLASELVRLSARIDPAQKASFAIMRALANAHTGAAGYLPKSDGRVPRLGPIANKWAKLIIKPAFTLHRTLIHPLRPQGSWKRRRDGALPLEVTLPALARFDDGRLSAWLQTQPVSTRTVLRAYQIHQALDVYGLGG